MLFNSLPFILCFLPVTVLFYFLCARWSTQVVAQLWLVGASLFFYGYWNINYLWLILVSTCVNYLVARRIMGLRAVGAILHARYWLLCGLAFNLGMLGYYKYVDFFIENINELAGANYALHGVILPLGISFFTFQKIAYLADSYKGHVKDHNFVRFVLFVVFFPQLISGPIVHHSQVIPQFSSMGNMQPNWKNLYVGKTIFFIGLFKKVVVADTFAAWADAGFNAGSPLGFREAWLTSMSYTMQIYFDFSAYSDMAIGAALMFNVMLPANFNLPYGALNIRDFWHRWHMTLSRWLRDYVYIPLGGNQSGPSRTSVNLVLTFLIGGFWHGAAWTFVAWGALHGIAVVLQRIWSAKGLTMPALPAWLLTFLFVSICWVFFRADSFETAWMLLKGMADLGTVMHPVSNPAFAQPPPGLLTLLFPQERVLGVYGLLLLAALLFSVRGIEPAEHGRSLLDSKASVYQVRSYPVVIMATISLFFLIYEENHSPFIYFNF